jgi:multidrug efflux system membrane fusion protein
MIRSGFSQRCLQGTVNFFRGKATVMSYVRIFTPVKIAIALAVLFAIWLLIGDKKRALDEPIAPPVEITDTLINVQITTSEAIDWHNDLVIQGQIKPWQAVTVAAQVAGQITELLASQGQFVETGQVLLKLSDEGRAQRLVQAQAELRLADKELVSAKTLESARLVAETELSRLLSAQEQAKANLQAAQLALAYQEPKAPFNGVVNRHYVDAGAFVQVGDPLMDVVDADKLKVVAYIPQQQVQPLKEGQVAELRLLDGRTFVGQVSFISYAAEQNTRAYLIEVSADNPERARIAGASVTVRISLPKIRVHRVSPALLSLNDRGQPGVSAVDDNNMVHFYPVTIVAIDNDGASLTGLPESFKLITLGAGFAVPGQQVQPVETEQ